MTDPTPRPSPDPTTADPDRPAPRPAFGRRAFVLGAATLGALAACGSGDYAEPVVTAGGPSGTGSASGGFDGDSADLAPDTFAVIQRFPQDVLAPGEVRVPFSLAGTDAQFVVDGPSPLGAQLVDVDGAPLGERVEAVRRDVAPAAYYAFRVPVADPGIYALVVDGGPAEGASFQVSEPGAIGVPGPGDALPPFDTPTTDDARGLDPICTREPACPFHELTLTEALAAGRPVAYLVGTPAFCQTGSCTPALEAMVELADEYADRFEFVHAEVFTDLTATTIAPAVEAVGMTYEPAVFLTDADGTVVDRLDGLWDVTELRERLDAATA